MIENQSWCLLLSVESGVSRTSIADHLNESDGAGEAVIADEDVSEHASGPAAVRFNRCGADERRQRFPWNLHPHDVSAARRHVAVAQWEELGDQLACDHRWLQLLNLSSGGEGSAELVEQATRTRRNQNGRNRCRRHGAEREHRHPPTACLADAVHLGEEPHADRAGRLQLLVVLGEGTQAARERSFRFVSIHDYFRDPTATRGTVSFISSKAFARCSRDRTVPTGHWATAAASA
jgi:hypothetical protein